LDGHPASASAITGATSMKKRRAIIVVLLRRVERGSDRTATSRSILVPLSNENTCG
jgi:hypothetical protein